MVREALRERFLEALEAAGGSAGNARMRATLGWQDPTYWNVQRTLIEEGTIQAGRGRGGSVAIYREPLKPKNSEVLKMLNLTVKARVGGERSKAHTQQRRRQ